MEVIKREYKNIPECYIRDDSEFTRPNVGRYVGCRYVRLIVGMHIIKV